MEEKILELLQDEHYSRRKINELASQLGQVETQAYINFIKLVNKLEDEGKIIRDSHNNYYLVNQLKYFKGVLSVHKKGFGFVRVDEDREFYINEKYIKDAFNGDIVLIEKVLTHGEKEEGKIIRVVERSSQRYVGEVKKGKRDLYVALDDPTIDEWVFVDDAHLHGASIGHKVVVEVKSYKPKLKGNIVQILGHKSDPGIDILSVVAQHNVDIDFPEDVYKEISNISEEIDPSDIKNRVDLRDELIVTIDGDDSKDFDDAISLKVLPNGNYQLGVHIADVSFYVKEGSPLDQEAIKRGTSIYLVDRVIPMLPHKLSNGICSLNEGVDRYCISCIMEIDKHGDVINHDILPTVINSSHRMTYNNVNAILQCNERLSHQYADSVGLFFLMKELSDILIQKRKDRGAIDFDVNEGKVIVNGKGKPLNVVLRERGEGERIIESFMLCANETIAEHFNWLDVPFIYRVHEPPKKDKLSQFVTMVKPLGYTIKGSLDNVYPKDISKLIEMSEGTEEHDIISTILLRCMSKARYDERCLGHFGLADDFYTHFTSPIRRYPDLLVHRLIREYIFNQDYSKVEHFSEVIPELAEKSSTAERTAIEIEREVDDMKMAEYMSYHIGEEYEGIISSVTSFGFFVELPNTIDGLVHVNDLYDDYYIYDEKNMMLIGERNHHMYKLSDKVKVRVKAASKKDKTIDFELVNNTRKKRTHKTIQMNKVKTNRSKKGKMRSRKK